MKIVYPMQLAGENGSSEIVSIDEFIKKINGLKSGTFPIGRNRIWHGGIHFSKSGGWHPSGVVRAIADGEIVAYRLATKPAKATRSPEAGKPGDDIELHTSPSFCLVRHRYEGGEQNKNRLTFYSLYMHIACENSYNSPEAARVTVKGSGVSTYEPVAQGDPLKLTRRLSGSSPVYAKTGAEVKLLQQTPSNLLNHRDEAHNYFLVHYVDEPNSPFYIAQSQLQHEYPQKPTWMTPPEGKPARHKVPSNTWLRKTADTTVGSMGLPAGSEVVVSSEPPQMVNLNGGTTEFHKVQVFKTGSGTVKDSANQVMTNAGKGTVGWLAKSKMGGGLTAEPSTPVEFKDDAPVVNRSANPIPVQAGEIIGHWGEHELATASASGFEKDADSKAVHFEVFVSESDKQALEDCINNKARVTGGQGYLLVKKEVTTYRLTSDSQHGFHEVANFGPLVLPLAVKESDIVTHGANNFVKVRERTTADGELPGEFVLKGGDVEVISQHDWHQLGVKLVDGSSDEDGFLDKADTESEDPQQKEASKFFSTLYDKLVTDRDNNGTLSGNDIKAALADEELAGKLRMLFIKHKSEWVKPGDWPRLKQELADQPKLYEYAMQVHRNMAWVEDASAILGDTKPWFIHPAGMMGLVKSYQKEALWVLGKTSERYESGGRGPGVVSTGKGDYGGASYGCYQLSSNLGVVQRYIQSSKYKGFFEGLLPATPQFNAAWKDVAANDPEGFREEQHRFIKETHYDIQIERLKSKGLLIEHARAAVHDLVWSTAVQFGAKTNLIINALSNSDLQNISDKELIITVQNYKKDNTETLFKSSPTWWKDLKDRADTEKKALLELESKMFEVEIK
ncbi:VgrG-related protein [Aeromonas allosaccharophila]|uniref:VgrG-related protein n=1 Tax=Aeromonas allosaccharophila TaxID=656 RepID=UPI0036DE5BE4